jgi:hypothetical protein
VETSASEPTTEAPAAEAAEAAPVKAAAAEATRICASRHEGQSGK